MNEQTARLLSEAAVLVAVVDQGVAWAAMLALQRCTGSDHLHTREVPWRPATLLRLGPVSARQSREDHRAEATDSFVELHRGRQKVEAVEEVRRGGQPAPETLQTKAPLEFSGRHPKDFGSGLIEIG